MPGGNESHQTNSCALQVIRPKVSLILCSSHTHHSHTGNKCNGMNHAGHARWKCKSPNKLLSLQVIRHTQKSIFLSSSHTTPHRKMTGNKCSGMNHTGHARGETQDTKLLLQVIRQKKSKKKGGFILSFSYTPLHTWRWLGINTVEWTAKSKPQNAEFLNSR